jgi:hypothetical protein
MQAKDAWKLALAIGLGVALILHAIFPRYEWRAVGDNGMVIVVYDRWANYFQRAVYDDKGNVTPMQPFKPF